jgi:hypothetical protein
MCKIKAVLIVVLLIVPVFAVFLFSCVPYVFSGSTVEMSGGSVRLYVVDLDGVGGFRAASHSAVVDGATQATFINIEHKLSIPVYISDWLVPDYAVDVYVNASYEIVHDWHTYKEIVESANNTIIVNTHDEILPVPDGYTKEEWTAVIADLILNRWGTWVHTGGLPFRIVQHENGATEEWTEGFKKLMKHANQNITIKNPPEVQGGLAIPEIHIEMGYGRTMQYLRDFGVLLFNETNYMSLSYFWHAVAKYANGLNHCLQYGQTDIDPSIIQIYSFNASEDLNVYSASTALRLSNNANRYGVFTYFSPWNFTDGGGNYVSDYNCGLGMGAIPTAAAIWCEAGYAAKKIVEANAAKVKDEAMVQKANDAFDAGNYKQAVIYAEKAATPSQPNILQAIILTTVTGAIIAATAAIYYRNNKNKKKR